MEMRDLLEKMMKFAGEPAQKPGDQWRGDDPNPPGKKLVGDSILKDLSKGKTPKTKEQELAEEFQAFLEAEFKDTVDKRPGRKSDRHARGHEPEPRYKTIKANEGAADQIYTVEITRSRGMGPSTTRKTSGTLAELIDYFGYTLEVGKSYERERGRYKINMMPRTIEQLVDNLNKAQSNAAANGMPSTYYDIGGEQMAEGWESGPPEYKEPYDDADDAYDRRRQEKMDIEAEKANAKRPQEKVYTLLGRGPNMEPNYKFPGEYKSQEAAMAAREKLMTDPDTPHPEHIGIHSYTRYLDQANEAVEGGGHIKDYNDYIKKLDNIYTALQDPKQEANWPWYRQALFDLNRMAKAQGFPVKESRGHKIIATKLKDIERARNFRMPSPEERRELDQRMKDFEAQLAAANSKKKSKVDEYGADNVSPYGQPTQTVDPKQAQQAAASLNIQKTALNQLRQINPEIDPIKAATAMTKDPETMNPQEKEAAAQVAKTVSPALGSPAFGSLKTAIQKLQAKK